MVERFYDHPLIAGLFRGKYTTDFREKKSPDTPLLPSYIPAENFAAALIDVFLNSSGSKEENITSPAVAGSPSNDTSSPLVIMSPPNAVSSPSAVTSPPPPASFSVDALRAAITANLTDPELGTAAKALRALVETAGNDAGKAKKNIENWFNGSMDRVSGWYKRRTQVITLLLGLGVAVGVNADAITISNSLSHDKALRDSMVAAAQEYAKKDSTNPKPDASAPPTPETTSSSSTAAVTPAAESFKAECTTNNNNKGLCSTACLKNVVSPECKLDVQLENIKGLGLPIGWDTKNTDLFPPGRDWSLIPVGRDWKLTTTLIGNWVLKIFGLLITAFAISLGAPFWFDLLNKFMVVRSTVKPKEKSPDEPSKG
ncbi:MAG TPA: hypothetical protein VGC97_15420 [Pyrinomonadaceae bacterium]